MKACFQYTANPSDLNPRISKFLGEVFFMFVTWFGFFFSLECIMEE